MNAFNLDAIFFHLENVKKYESKHEEWRDIFNTLCGKYFAEIFRLEYSFPYFPFIHPYFHFMYY